MRATSEPIVIRCGKLQAEIVPEIGGSLARLNWRDHDLMRPLSGDDRRRRNVIGAAMFAMVPYANRIANNKFLFNGRWHSLRPNNPPERFNVHGCGWQLAWETEQVSPTRATLGLVVDNDGFPHRFRARQSFEVGAGGLRAEISVSNLADFAMPFGFGFHPWFGRESGVRVQFAAERFYLEEPDGISGDPVSIPPELDFARPRPLPGGWRNNDYGGWKGKAEIAYPDRGFGVRITADPVFGHLMVYADPQKPVFCLEPQTNAACAFNRRGMGAPENGVIVLEPGQSAGGSVTFQPFEI